MLLRKCSAVEQAASGGIAVIVYHRSTLEEQKNHNISKPFANNFTHCFVFLCSVIFVVVAVAAIVLVVPF